MRSTCTSSASSSTAGLPLRPSVSYRRLSRLRARRPEAWRLSFALSITPTVALWNAVAVGLEPSSAAYVLALTALLLVRGWAFVQNLAIFFPDGRAHLHAHRLASGA
jgi:hypothetical protein